MQRAPTCTVFVSTISSPGRGGLKKKRDCFRRPNALSRGRSPPPSQNGKVWRLFYAGGEPVRWGCPPFSPVGTPRVGPWPDTFKSGARRTSPLHAPPLRGTSSLTTFIINYLCLTVAGLSRPPQSKTCPVCFISHELVFIAAQHLESCRRVASFVVRLIVYRFPRTE